MLFSQLQLHMNPFVHTRFTGQVYAIYDGHAGSACAEYLAKQLPKAILAALKWKTSNTKPPRGANHAVLASQVVETTLPKVFEEVDTRFLTKAKKVGIVCARGK